MGVVLVLAEATGCVVKKATLEQVTLARRLGTPVVVWTAAGLDDAKLGASASWSVVEDFAARPPKAAGTVVADDGEGGVRIAGFLAEQKFI